LVYEELPSTVDPGAALIYLWQVWTREGEIVYRYVGKAEGGASRPRDHYRRNVRNLLSGKPYRAGKPDEFRVVHRRLAEAMRNGERVTLTLLCNVSTGEDINEAERRLQKEHGC
jgi:hypothetical protein